MTSIIIPDGVTSIGSSVFYGWTSNQIIHIEAEKQPSGWSSSWKSGCNATVEWSYNGE